MTKVSKTRHTLLRPSFEDIYMQLAMHLRQRSTCSRLRVGCVITSATFEQVLALGYNGNAKGLANKCDRDEPGNCGCLHAEDNAVAKLKKHKNMVVFMTHAPCTYCAKRFINVGGIKRLYYRIPYRKRDGIKLLISAGIDVWEI